MKRMKTLKRIKPLQAFCSALMAGCLTVTALPPVAFAQNNDVTLNFVNAEIDGVARAMGAIMNAIEQGEIVGRAADFEGIKVGRPHWLRDNLVTLYVQEGTRRDKEMPNVPALLELVSSGPDREIVEFFASAATLGRIYVAPPDVPADRQRLIYSGMSCTPIHT